MNIKKKYTIILSILLSIYSIVATSIPFLTSLLVDEAIALYDKKENTWDTLIIVMIAFGAVVLFEILITLLNNYFKYRFSLTLEKELKKDFYTNIISKEIEDLNKYNGAELEQLFNVDIGNVIAKYLDIIPGIVKDISRVLLSIALVIYFDWMFLVGLVVVGCVGFLAAKFYIHIIKPHHQKTLESEASVSGFVLDSVANAKLIKAYDAHVNAGNHFDELISKMIINKKKKNRINVIASSGLFGFCNLLYVVALCYGGYAIAAGLFTYGTLMALVQLLSYIESPVLEFSSVLNSLSLANTSLNRLIDFKKLNNEEPSEVIESFEGIRFDNVSFSYDKNVIKDLTFNVKPNQTVLVKGPSGIGKTTLMMIVLGFLKPQSGKALIKYNGKEEEASSKARRLFSYVPQDNILFKGTIKENIEILTGIGDDDKIIEALRISNVYDEIMELPKGINTELNDRGRGLSLGQIQRVLIAIAILNDAKVLLLDEFSSALDSTNEQIIIDNLSKLNKTIIYITHKDSNLKNDLVVDLGENYE